MSYLAWALLTATCLSSAFQFINIEAMMGYVELEGKSINNTEYGIYIPPNITDPVDFLPRFYKLTGKCRGKVLFSDYIDIEYFLHTYPFSAEFFLLASCFCIIKWKNVLTPHRQLGRGKVYSTRFQNLIVFLCIFGL